MLTVHERPRALFKQGTADPPSAARRQEPRSFTFEVASRLSGECPAATKLPRRAVTGLGACMEESEFPWHRLPSNHECAVNARLPATTGPTATPSALPLTWFRCASRVPYGPARRYPHFGHTVAGPLSPALLLRGTLGFEALRPAGRASRNRAVLDEMPSFKWSPHGVLTPDFRFERPASFH
jgi:hypothetical protein